MIRTVCWSVLCLALLSISCGSDRIITPVYYPAWIEIQGSYFNSDGHSPSFALDSQSVRGGKITYDSSTCGFLQSDPPGEHPVRIILKNVSVLDSLGNSAVDSLNVEELRSGKWIEDVEFRKSYTRLTKMAVVLVLDVSSSLGNDYERVKQYASRFVEIVNKNNPQTKIGVVVFSRSIDSLEPTTSVAAINAKINEQANREHSTALYSAMQTGINMLKRTAADGKALVAFTDGTDNFSTVTSEEVFQAIQENSINSYTIGLEGKGGIDSDVLKHLANREFRAAPNITALDEIFARFSRVVSNIYDVTYRRNEQVIPETAPIRIKFRFRTAPEVGF